MPRSGLGLSRGRRRSVKLSTVEKLQFVIAFLVAIIILLVLYIHD